MGSRTRTQRGECMDMNRRKYYVARERVIYEREGDEDDEREAG